MKNKKQDPYEVQLADLANEIGGNMAVEYYNVSFTLTKEQLQDMKDKGLRTDIMSCIMAALIMNGKNEAENKSILRRSPSGRGSSQRHIRGSRRWSTQCHVA